MAKHPPTSKLTRAYRDAEERKYLGDLHIGSLEIFRNAINVKVVNDHLQPVVTLHLSYLGGDPDSDTVEKIAFGLQLALFPLIQHALTQYSDAENDRLDAIHKALGKSDASTWGYDEDKIADLGDALTKLAEASRASSFKKADPDDPPIMNEDALQADIDHGVLGEDEA